MKVKTYTLKIDNSNIMNSIEKAELKITSPKNKTIRLKKMRAMFKTTDEQRSVFWKFADKENEMEATKEEMQILLDISKL